MNNIINNIKRDDKAQVGIGTLIVFIALVLVAAIAAGVLINTAGFLQTQAESTGQESTEQVSNSLNVASVIGEADGDPDIDVIELRVSLAPGSDSIDLSEVTIEWVGESNTATLTVAEAAAGDTLDTFRSGSVSSSTDTEAAIPAGENVVLNDPDQRSTIVIADTDVGTDFGSNDDLSEDTPLVAGNEATATIVTPGGSQTTVSITVPEPLSQDAGVSL